MWSRKEGSGEPGHCPDEEIPALLVHKLGPGLKTRRNKAKVMKVDFRSFFVPSLTHDQWLNPSTGPPGILKPLGTPTSNYNNNLLYDNKKLQGSVATMPFSLDQPRGKGNQERKPGRNSSHTGFGKQDREKK